MSPEPERDDNLKPDETVDDLSAPADSSGAEETESAQPADQATESPGQGAMEDSADSAASEEAAVESEAVESEAVEAAESEVAESEVAESEVEQSELVLTEAEAETPEASGEEPEEPQAEKQWYILKVQVNREDSIRDALVRRIKIAGLEDDFGDVVVPTEDVAEFNKSGKRRVVKKKLYPGYIMANLILNDDTWFLVRETPGIGDFTGSAGKPTPMDPQEVKRIIKVPTDSGKEEPQVRTSIPFSIGDRVRVKEGYFENFEGDVDSIDEANGRVTIMISIFGRSTPVELEHWQIESV